MATYRRINVTDARTRFAEVVDQVHYQGDIVMLCKSGKPVAVMVSVEFFEQWRIAMETTVRLAQSVKQNLSSSD